MATATVPATPVGTAIDCAGTAGRASPGCHVGASAHVARLQSQEPFAVRYRAVTAGTYPRAERCNISHWPGTRRQGSVTAGRRTGKLRAVLIYPVDDRTLRADFSDNHAENAMGRGDRKTQKGKRSIRSYGNVRPHKSATTKNAPVAKKAAPAVKMRHPISVWESHLTEPSKDL